MTNVKAVETGWRGSRELWLTAAYDCLIDSGVDAVRIQAIGKRLDLSRTSFYWFFQDREALLDALLELWREKNIGNLIKQTAAYAGSIAEAILNLFDCWLDRTLFDSQLEFAVRSWALQSAQVGVEIVKADLARITAITGMFERFGFSATDADVRARTIYLTQIGYISMNTQEDLATRMKRIPYYVTIFTGSVVQPQELARFHARHSFPAATRRGRKGGEAA
ncbi:MAG: TetR/AcrR family transcriptional regulator [Proteobacteria bacterium]|nr:TetR/AcrR family transcriptional regulator [Pseudomonadota bacterium]